jgi:hypothetical protein
VSEFVTITRKYFPSKDIVLLSNGLLLPKMSNDFYQNLINNHAFLSVTMYPINFDYGILNDLKKMGVEILAHEIYDGTLQGFSRQ